MKWYVPEVPEVGLAKPPEGGSVAAQSSQGTAQPVDPFQGSTIGEAGHEGRQTNEPRYCHPGAGCPFGLPVLTPATATPARITRVVDRGPGWAYQEGANRRIGC